MKSRRFKEGDTVRFRFGLKRVQGRVIEDMGPLGGNGQELYVVAFRGGSLTIRIPDYELSPVKSRPSNPSGRSPRRKQSA